MEQFNGISKEKLDFILENIRGLRLGVIGDLCLDVYWKADMKRSSLSRETPHYPLPIVKEYMSLGGAGNVAANAVSLKYAEVVVMGVVGIDWRGDSLLKILNSTNIDTRNIVVSDTTVTNAYCKPMRTGISEVEYEDPRLDFNNFVPLSKDDEEQLICILDKAAKKLDVICVSDQLEYGCITPNIRNRIIQLSMGGMKVIVDSRDRINLFTNVILKPNEVEAIKTKNPQLYPTTTSMNEKIEASLMLASDNSASVCMTLGKNGSMVIDKNTKVYIPAFKVKTPIDICGAGDTFLSAFSGAIACGVQSFEAASFANIAADITVKKIGITGTASPEEIVKRHMEVITGNPSAEWSDLETYEWPAPDMDHLYEGNETPMNYN